MFTDMQKWAEIRRRVHSGEISKRAACAEYEIHWETLQKILTHSEPPGYRRTKPRASKLDSFLPIIHEWFIFRRTIVGFDSGVSVHLLFPLHVYPTTSRLAPKTRVL